MNCFSDFVLKLNIALPKDKWQAPWDSKSRGHLWIEHLEDSGLMIFSYQLNDVRLIFVATSEILLEFGGFSY